MSATPSERQTDIKTDGGEKVGFVEANSHALGSRSLQAGGEFLKALASDLAALASRLRSSLIPEHRRTQPSRASASLRISWGSAAGTRVLRFLRIALLGLVSASALVIV